MSVELLLYLVIAFIVLLIHKADLIARGDGRSVGRVHLSVHMPTKFELVTNLKTVQALDSTCPTSRWMMSQWMSQLIAVSPVAALCGHRASVALEIWVRA